MICLFGITKLDIVRDTHLRHGFVDINAELGTVKFIVPSSAQPNYLIVRLYIDVNRTIAPISCNTRSTTEGLLVYHTSFNSSSYRIHSRHPDLSV